MNAPPTQATDEALTLADALDKHCAYEGGMTDHELFRCSQLLRELARLRTANTALTKALEAAILEFEDVCEWARVERAPLREQEIASVVRAASAARAALASVEKP